MQEKQAVALAESIKNVNLEYVATKEDLLKLESSFESKLYKLEIRLYKTGFLALLAQAALIVALIQLFGS